MHFISMRKIPFHSSILTCFLGYISLKKSIPAPLHLYKMSSTVITVHLGLLLFLLFIISLSLSIFCFISKKGNGCTCMCVYVAGEEERRKREGWQAKAYSLPDCPSTHLDNSKDIFDEIRFLAGWWLNLHVMEVHYIAVIERNAYIKPRDGSLAANPALGGCSAILPHVYSSDVYPQFSFATCVLQT